MEVLTLLIPLALLLGLIFLGIFIWATKRGQFDDLVTPASRILFEDEKMNKKNNNTSLGEKKDE